MNMSPPPTIEDIRAELGRITRRRGLHMWSDEKLDGELIWWRGELARRQRVASAAQHDVFAAMNQLGGLEFEEERRAGLASTDPEKKDPHT